MSGENFELEFDPLAFVPGSTPLKRPRFLAIISSAALALTLARKCQPPVDGFIIEGPVAGGHNAPPRGPLVLDEFNEPVYGPRDEPDLGAIREIGLPFWLAGGYSTSDRLQEALASGAAGVQVGTAFALCEESGIAPRLKSATLDRVLAGEARVHTDPVASPTGFPFKVVDLEGTLSKDEVYKARTRICDLGYLRQAYRKEDGSVGFRCPGEPEDDYLSKGGNLDESVGRKCICNGLLSTIGLGQVRDGRPEPPIVTAGDDLATVGRFLKPGKRTYSADDVLNCLLAEANSTSS
jgi:nitronate monooxygenase